jgi:hypothetical protein
MAKNITPQLGKNYAVFSVSKEWITFTVTNIVGTTVYVDWTSENPKNYAPVFGDYDFLNQDGANYHILEITKPEDLFIYQLKYTS